MKNEVSKLAMKREKAVHVTIEGLLLMSEFGFYGMA